MTLDHKDYVNYLPEVRALVNKVVQRNMAEGIPFSDTLRREVFERVFQDLERLVDDHPHIVVDETLHKRDIRHFLYEKAEAIDASP